MNFYSLSFDFPASVSVFPMTLKRNWIRIWIIISVKAEIASIARLSLRSYLHYSISCQIAHTVSPFTPFVFDGILKYKYFKWLLQVNLQIFDNYDGNELLSVVSV